MATGPAAFGNAPTGGSSGCHIYSQPGRVDVNSGMDMDCDGISDWIDPCPNDPTNFCTMLRDINRTHEQGWREMAREAGLCQTANGLNIAGASIALAGAIVALFGGAGVPAIILGGALIFLAAIIDGVLDC